MSVRNHYARNYTKVSPFPPSNKIIVEAKTASRKAGYSRASGDKKANTEHGTIKFDGGNKIEMIDKHALDNIAKTSANVIGCEKGDTERRGSFNDGSGKKVRRGDNRTFSETVTTTNGSDILQVWHNDRNKIEDNMPSYKPHSDDNPKTHDNDNQDIKPARPKSARPESRHERRIVDHDYEINERQQSKPVRPKSARPESRMMRMVDAHEQEEFSGKADLPPRPRTSYGQRRGSGTESEISLNMNERPKSRIGSYGKQPSYDSDEPVIQPKKRDKKSKRHHNKDTVQNYSRPLHDESVILYTDPAYSTCSDSPQENFTKWRSKTVLDLNSGIDDIDLDMDPVQYFMQDDNALPEKSGKTKRSLSKDTINFIGNADSQRQGNPVIGYHDNYLDNKFHSAAGKHDHRFHGDRVNSVQNSILDAERFSLNQTRRSKTRNDPFVKDRIRHPQSGDMPYMDSFPDSYNYLKLNRPREIINECRGKISSDTAISGRYQSNGGVASDNRGGVSYRRHPRKLQPISAFNNNT